MRLHDTHFHLDLAQYPDKLVQIIERAEVYTVAVTNLPELFEHTFNLTKRSKFVRAALGFHPELASVHKEQIRTFEKNLDQSRYIGEVGLDNSNKAPSDYSDQKRIFEKIIQLCHESGDKILTVHSRRSESDVNSIIGRNFNGKIVLHWYSGSLKELDKAISFGFYFSVNYAMCISEKGRQIINRIPYDKILLETDGPFIKMEKKICDPTSVVVIEKEIIRLRSLLNPLSSNSLYENFKRLVS